mgnify:CR=1 FL=1
MQPRRGAVLSAPLPEEMVRTALDTGLLAVLRFELGLRTDDCGIVTGEQYQSPPGADALMTALRQVAGGRYGGFEIQDPSLYTSSCAGLNHPGRMPAPKRCTCSLEASLVARPSPDPDSR